uniref:Copine C-terminal domain-containing protein n=1 Tax=Medicago truncatula TaxID=3880 RepID=A2Q1W6_MEDTR|nr:hypothetical protein MtrDRAFT_AC149129g23v2 [Medicago truncatula]
MAVGGGGSVKNPAICGCSAQPTGVGGGALVIRRNDAQHGSLSSQKLHTVDAIVEARKFPLSIILVGVGDGPWDMVKEFQDNIKMQTRTFHNFKFVNFTEIMSKSNNISPSLKEAEILLAIREILFQYKAAKELGLLGVALPTPSASRGTSKPYYRSASFPSASSRPYQSASFEGRAPFYPNDNNLASPSSTYYNKAKRESGLPLSLKKLGNTREKKSLTWKAFISHACDSVLDIPPKYHWALLLICVSFLSYQAKNTTAPFEYFQLEKTIKAPPQTLVLAFGEAFEVFFPEITHITKFMLCYFLTLMLVCSLQLGLQIFCILLIISAPLFYFPELVRRASKVGVDCGLFELPLIWFATLGAVGLSLICGILTLLLAYLSWRFLSKGKQNVEDVDVSLEELSEILQV